MITRRLSGTFMEICTHEDIAVTTLTFWGHVTSSVAWPFDSPCGVFYRLSVITRRPSGTVREMFSLQDWGHDLDRLGVT